MKVHKMITIDMDLAEKLNVEKNISSLVNSLLLEHYKRIDDPYIGMNKEEFAFAKERDLYLWDIQQKMDKKLEEIKKKHGR